MSPVLQPIQQPQTGCPGASVEGTEILTGVLEATVRDPSRSSPGAKLMDGLTHPSMGRRRRATRPNFHACEAYARTECSWQNQRQSGPSPPANDIGHAIQVGPAGASCISCPHPVDSAVSV